MDFTRLKELAAEIKRLGTGPASFRARWEFGRELDGLGALAKDTRAAIATDTGIGGAAGHGTDFYAMRSFFRKYPTEASLAEVTAQRLHGSRGIPQQIGSGDGTTRRCKYGLILAGEAVAEVLKLAALPQPVTPDQIKDVSGCHSVKGVYSFLHRAAILPWLTVMKNRDGNYTFTIDYDLKEICDRHQPGAVGELSLADHLAHIHKEIREMRERNKIERERRRWNPESTVKAELLAILDYVENELDRIPSTATRLARLSAAAKPNEYTATGGHNDNQKGNRRSSIDTAVGNVVYDDEAAAG